MGRKRITIYADEEPVAAAEREKILAHLRRLLVDHCAEANSPPPTSGMPSPRHIAHWSRRDTLKEIIEDIEQKVWGNE